LHLVGHINKRLSNDARTHEREMTKLIVTFRNFSEASNKTEKLRKHDTRWNFRKVHRQGRV